MNKVEVTCHYCKKTSEIQMTPETMASWFSAGKRQAPEATDERIWELLKTTIVCPDCLKEHPPSTGSFAVGCACGTCKS